MTNPPKPTKDEIERVEAWFKAEKERRDAKWERDRKKRVRDAQKHVEAGMVGKTVERIEGLETSDVGEASQVRIHFTDGTHVWLDAADRFFYIDFRDAEGSQFDPVKEKPALAPTEGGGNVRS